MLAEEVEKADVEYADPVLRVLVTVEAEPVALPEVEELELPVMWKGKEYWKMVESESRVSLNPNVANEPIEDGMAQLYFPSEFAIPALITSPNSRVAGVAPWRRVMVTVSELYFALGSQTMFKVEPAATFWS